MSRGLTAGMLSAINQGTVYPILFAYFNFAGGAVRVCTDVRTVTWNGNDWSGLGNFVGLTPMQETKDVQANGIQFTLRGVDSSYITEVMTLRSRGRACTLWLGLYDSSGALINDPVIIFSGRMDQPQIQDENTTCVIIISAESRLVDLQRPRSSRYTDEEQQARFTGDLGLAFVASLQDKSVRWGPGNSATGSPQASSNQRPSGGITGGSGISVPTTLL